MDQPAEQAVGERDLQDVALVALDQQPAVGEGLRRVEAGDVLQRAPAVDAAVGQVLPGDVGKQYMLEVQRAVAAVDLVQPLRKRAGRPPPPSSCSTRLAPWA
jgi:hypothetical protein